MYYNTKNYTEQGGAVTHIGGELILEDGAKLTGFPKTAKQEASTATTVAALKDDLNDLIEKLIAAGLMQEE